MPLSPLFIMVYGITFSKTQNVKCNFSIFWILRHHVFKGLTVFSNNNKNKIFTLGKCKKCKNVIFRL